VSKYFSKKNAQNQYDVSQSIIVIQAGKNGQGLCSPPTAATTWYQSKMIMMCDDSFDRPTLAQVYAEQDSLSSGTSIDTLQTAGAEFLHEMLHYLGRGSKSQRLKQIPGQQLV
jgi:hypothetical protein